MKYPVLLLFSLLQITIASAGEYTPEGLYDLTRLRLDNGLEIYLKERHEAKSSSIRLLVDYGSDDNECGKTESAHYLEHLLFTGTSRHNEVQLDKLITDNGGSWNAFTSSEGTSYEIDIYSHYTLLALDVLHEIITDSTITQENVETTLDIITRESGGEHSWLTRYLFTLGIGKTGYDKGKEILYSASEYCPIIENYSDISRDEILEKLHRYYVPDNMALILVGDFDSEEVIHRIRQTFGSMPGTQPAIERPYQPHHYPPQDKIYTGTFNPFKGNDATVYIRYRIPGYQSEESMTLALLSLYLSERLYNTIRVSRGLSYGALADAGFSQNYGTLQLYADAEIRDMDTVTRLMLEEVDALLKKPVPEQELERIKRGALLNYVHAFQDNVTIANFYKNQWQDKLTMDGFIKLEDLITAVKAEDMHQVAKKYLGRERAVISHDSPTITNEQTYVLIGLLVLLTIYSMRRYLLRQRRKV